MQTGKRSRRLGLRDELAEIETATAIPIRSALKHMHPWALKWLNERGIEASRPAAGKSKKRRFQRKAGR